MCRLSDVCDVRDVCGSWFVVCGVWCMVCRVWFDGWAVRFAVCEPFPDEWGESSPYVVLPHDDEESLLCIELPSLSTQVLAVPATTQTALVMTSVMTQTSGTEVVSQAESSTGAQHVVDMTVSGSCALVGGLMESVGKCEFPGIDVNSTLR